MKFWFDNHLTIALTVSSRKGCNYVGLSIN